MQRIKEFIREYKSLRGISYADSIINSSSKVSETNCIYGLWFRFERGELLELNNRFDRAIFEYYEIIRLAEKRKQLDLVCQSHISLARCFEAIGRKSDCLRHLTIAKEIIDAAGFESIMARYSYRYASYHRLYDSKDTARVYAQKAVDLGEKYKFRRAITDGHLILGILSKNIDTATYHFRLVAELFAQHGDFHGAASQIQNVANRLFSANKKKEALITLDSAQHYAFKIEKNTKPFHEILSGIYHKKSIIFDQLGQLDSAFHYLKLSRDAYLFSEYSLSQDSITQRAMDFAIQKEKEKNVYLEKSTMLLRWGFIATIATLILFLVLFAINRKRRLKIEKQNNIIQEQNTALEHLFQKQSTLLSEVHHRVKNNLQLVISLLTLHGKNYQDKPLNDLMDEVSAKVKSIALIHEQLYSTGEFEKIHVQEYLEKLMQNFEALQAEKNSFEYEVKVDDLFFNLETVMPIGIIASELISNALKYARIKNQDLFLSMAVHKTENGYIFSYHDNGPGIKAEIENSDKNTIGMSLIKSMVRQLQADSKSFNQKGYHFTMVFQEKKVSKI